MYCPNCGKEIAAQSVYCPECGQKIGPSQNSAAPAAHGADPTAPSWQHSDSPGRTVSPPPYPPVDYGRQPYSGSAPYAYPQPPAPGGAYVRPGMPPYPPRKKHTGVVIVVVVAAVLLLGLIAGAVILLGTDSAYALRDTSWEVVRIDMEDGAYFDQEEILAYGSGSNGYIFFDDADGGTISLPLLENPNVLSFTYTLDDGALTFYFSDDDSDVWEAIYIDDEIDLYMADESGSVGDSIIVYQLIG